MDLVELILDEDNGLNGVYAISIVDKPAIEADFVHFSKGHEVAFTSLDTEKRLLLGPILIPNKPILRRDKDGNEFYAYLSAQTVERSAHLYQHQGLQNKSTLEHEVKIEGVTLVETWIVEDPEKDKTRAHMDALPKGTWAGVMKVNNDQLWNEYVKTGYVNGFSIEGNYKAVERDTTKMSQHGHIEDGILECYEMLANGLIDLATRL